MKKIFRITIQSRKTKEGRSFPVYRAKTMKDAWFDVVFCKEAQTIKKACCIEIEEENFSMGYKTNKDNETIKDKNGNLIPQIFIKGDYRILTDEETPKELEPKKVYDSYKELF